MSRRESMEATINRVEEIAKKKGISMAQVSIAWQLSKEGVTAPIIGATKVKYVHDIAGAMDVKLSAEEIEYLEGAYKPQNTWGYR
ncbi:Aldo/keto reductase [Gloeophyllum trabeum ATCC 11539]|uniref:Aldo/keto reductase n=1 Tax=Gloeophyllum trabeum (strain ATCC 11539 / FP-39264 / Madison 617) TaxID=670483 RepID=S7PSR8_GLOTA|nr:Aldo/keto reductase [Gloeophyllum trabeum ATCC 11539]EPQ50861.1 Aldo/keto reductase [Gloeophyllum trabeum ATCC 11539]